MAAALFVFQASPLLAGAERRHEIAAQRTQHPIFGTAANNNRPVWYIKFGKGKTETPAAVGRRGRGPRRSSDAGRSHASE